MEDSKHSVSTFRVNEWINEMVSERLELNLSWKWGCFQKYGSFATKEKYPALNAADKLVFKENDNTCV